MKGRDTALRRIHLAVAWGLALAPVPALGVMVACGGASPVASSAPGSGSELASTSIADGGIEPVSSRPAASVPAAASDAGRATPEEFDGGDELADSPNGKCRAASAPSPEFHAATLAAAQSTLICYEFALKRGAASVGHLEVGLDVNDNGSLRNAVIISDDFADRSLRTCAIRKLRDVTYPAPATGCGAVSRIPLTFLRTDGGGL